jgi:hypothetical protein
LRTSFPQQKLIIMDSIFVLLALFYSVFCAIAIGAALFLGWKMLHKDNPPEDIELSQCPAI